MPFIDQIHELTDTKWKDIGEHLSSDFDQFRARGRNSFAEIVSVWRSDLLCSNSTRTNQALWARNWAHGGPIVLGSTQVRWVKRPRWPYRSSCASCLEDIKIITKNGYGLRFNMEEVPVVGAKVAGVAINLKDGDRCVAAFKSTTPMAFWLNEASLKWMLQHDIPWLVGPT